MSSNLRSLMDFNFSTIGKILSQAELVAVELLNRYLLTNELKQERRINTLEFYLANSVLPDYSSQKGAAHEREEQKQKCLFYVHTKSKNGWTSPIFNRHGIDITCGDENCYGGILIREIENRNNVEGSGRTLRALLRGDAGYDPVPRTSEEHGWSEREKEILERLNGASVFHNGTNIRLKKTKDRRLKIYKGERVGIEKTRFSKLKLRFSIRKINHCFEECC